MLRLLIAMASETLAFHCCETCQRSETSVSVNGETYPFVASDERLLEVIGKEGDDHDGKDELEDAQDEIGEVDLA